VAGNAEASVPAHASKRSAKSFDQAFLYRVRAACSALLGFRCLALPLRFRHQTSREFSVPVDVLLTRFHARLAVFGTRRD
jgi:hypothetical protein